MDDSREEDWVLISVPKNGVYGDAPTKIRFPKVCRCGKTHSFEPPNPQIGDWYSCVDDPCEHTVTYTSIWELRKVRSTRKSGGT